MKTVSRILYYVFAVCLSLLAAALFTSQLLGFLSFYRPWLAVLLTLVLGAAAFYYYVSWEGGRFYAAALAEPEEQHTRRVWLDGFMLGSGLLLLALLVLLPLVRWPYSPISETLHWDAGAYHFPKAVELWRTGTYWDLSIPYGEFPNGFESLLSFCLSITGNEALFGSAHAMIALAFCLAVWLLARRYTRLPGGLLLFLTSMLVLSGELFVAFNPWWILSNQVFMIGKNDLLISLAALAVLLHAPVGTDRNKTAEHVPGMAYATLTALATKPMGLYVAAPLWLLVLYEGWKRKALPWKDLLLSAAIILPGGLWIVRNLIVIRVVFPKAVWVYQTWSIAYNLTNSFFYRYVPKNLWFVVLALVLCLILAFWRKNPTWKMAAALVLVFITFTVTPESAFFARTDQPTMIAWRFGMVLLVYEFVLLLAAAEPLIRRAYAWVVGKAALQWIVTGGVILASLGMIWQLRPLLDYRPKNAIVLRDQFREPVGVDGYYSAYDYVQKNIRNSVIQVDNGVLYYVYGPGFTNYPTKLQYPLGMEQMVKQLVPQYYLVFSRAWISEQQGFPAYVDSPGWDSKWALIYSDPEGRIYRRK